MNRDNGVRIEHGQPIDLRMQISEQDEGERDWRGCRHAGLLRAAGMPGARATLETRTILRLWPAAVMAEPPAVTRRRLARLILLLRVS